MLVLGTEKMYQIFIGFCVILSLFNGCSAEIHLEKSDVDINCNPKTSGTMTFMFQISSTGAKCLLIAKQTDVKHNADANKYQHVSLDSNGNLRFKIKSFAKKTDSGLYTCATMNNNKLFFGEVAEIQGVPDPTQAPKVIQTTTKPVVETTTKQCCKKVPEPKFNCETWILTSLAGGCGLFLFLLIATIVYCNRLRTRRCPHHYKRQPRGPPAGHAKMPNSHF